MAKSPPVTFNTHLAEALGLDPHNIGSIRIEVDPHSAQVTIVRYLFDDETQERVRRLLEKYDLVPKEDD